MAKIAVVEDNDAMRAQLCGFIAQYAQESGHQLDVTAFSDGAQLVEPYRPGFDIIFLDIEMPKLGGRAHPQAGPGCGARVRHQHGTVCHPRV